MGGNVGINNNIPASYYSNQFVVGAGNENGITIASTNTTNENYLMFADGTSGADAYRGYIGYNHTSNYLRFGSDGTERMRITSGGYLKASNDGTYDNATGTYHEINSNVNSYAAVRIRNTNASAPAGVDIGFPSAAPNNTTQAFLYCYDSSVGCYTIWSNGTTSGRSDERLKRNIIGASSKLQDLMKLNVVNYEWNDSVDGIKEIGLIAQDVEKVFPSLVINGREDENGNSYKQIKYSVLPIINTKSIQELYLIVQEQQAQIEELKSKLN